MFWLNRMRLRLLTEAFFFSFHAKCFSLDVVSFKTTEAWFMRYERNFEWTSKWVFLLFTVGGEEKLESTPLQASFLMTEAFVFVDKVGPGMSSRIKKWEKRNSKVFRDPNRKGAQMRAWMRSVMRINQAMRVPDLQCFLNLFKSNCLLPSKYCFIA